MMFIVLTNTDGNKVRWNIAHIVNYRSEYKGNKTVINDTNHVKESPEQIDEMLRRVEIDILRWDVT